MKKVKKLNENDDKNMANNNKDNCKITKNNQANGDENKLTRRKQRKDLIENEHCLEFKKEAAASGRGMKKISRKNRQGK